MLDFLGKYKAMIIGIITVLVIILIIYFYGKQKGKEYTPADVVLPPDLQGKGVPKNWNPGTYTDALFDDLDTVFSTHSALPYDNAMQLSNSQLVAIYNDWNKRYFKPFGNKTIIQAIQGDTSIWNYAWAKSTGQLVERLKSLNLT